MAGQALYFHIGRPGLGVGTELIPGGPGGRSRMHQGPVRDEEQLDWVWLSQDAETAIAYSLYAMNHFGIQPAIYLARPTAKVEERTGFHSGSNAPQLITKSAVVVAQFPWLYEQLRTFDWTSWWLDAHPEARALPNSYQIQYQMLEEWRSAVSQGLPLELPGIGVVAALADMSAPLIGVFPFDAPGWEDDTYEIAGPIDSFGNTAVQARVRETEIGYLLWRADGEIAMVQVNDPYQRKGVASQMLACARQIDPNVHHSRSRTEDGKAWAEHVGTKTAAGAGTIYRGLKIAIDPWEFYGSMAQGLDVAARMVIEKAQEEQGRAGLGSHWSFSIDVSWKFAATQAEQVVLIDPGSIYSYVGVVLEGTYESDQVAYRPDELESTQQDIHRIDIPEEYEVTLRHGARVNIQAVHLCVPRDLAKVQRVLDDGEGAVRLPYITQRVPLTISLTAAYVERPMAQGPYFHGTNVALAPGDTIRPASATGTASRFVDFDFYDPSKVYLTNQPHLAARYAYKAAQHGGGEPHVYEVRPIGMVYADPEYVESGFGSDQVVAALGEVVRELPFTEVAEKRYLGKEAAWADVRSKAREIRSGGGVKIIAAAGDQITAEVKSTTGSVYQTSLLREPGTKSVAMWECFLPDAPVLMADGTERPISDVVPGDEVITHEGRIARVMRAEPKPYDGDIVTVRFRGDYRPLVATAGHEVYAANRDYALRGAGRDVLYKTTGSTVPVLAPRDGWIPIEQLAPSDYLSRSVVGVEEPLVVTCPAPVGNRAHGYTHDDLDVKVDADLAYWLGWYMAEGSLVGRGHRVVFSLAPDEEWVCDRLDAITQAHFGVVGTRRYRESTIDYRVSHFALAHLARTLIGSGSTTKRLAPGMLVLPLPEQESFMEAWVAGDGHIEPRGVTTLHAANETSMRQAREVLGRLGIVANLRMAATNPGGLASTQNGGPIWRLQWAGGQRTISQFRQDGLIWHKITSVECTHYTGDVWDIEVEEDHSFRAYGMNVHNCTCPWSAYSWGRSGRWKKYEGRMCAHALALVYEAQAQEWGGNNVTEGPGHGEEITFYEAPPVGEWRVDTPVRPGDMAIGASLRVMAARGGRTGVPEIDAIIEAFLASRLSNGYPVTGLIDCEASNGYCQEVTEEFVAFAKARGYERVYSTNTDLREMGYRRHGVPDHIGRYHEHTVASFYVDGQAWPWIVDFTASQYGYKDLPKVTSSLVKAATQTTRAYRGFTLQITDLATAKRFTEACAANDTAAAGRIIADQIRTGDRVRWWSGGASDPGRGLGTWWCSSETDATNYSFEIVDSFQVLGVSIVLCAEVGEEWGEGEVDGTWTTFWHLDPNTPVSLLSATATVPTAAGAKAALEEFAGQGQWATIYDLGFTGGDGGRDIELPLGSLPRTAVATGRKGEVWVWHEGEGRGSMRTSDRGRLLSLGGGITTKASVESPPWTDTTMSIAALRAIALPGRLDAMDAESSKIVDLALAIAAHGITQPLFVEETNQGLLMTDGHHRLIAAEEIGLTELPVRVFANTPEGRSAANRAMVALAKTAAPVDDYGMSHRPSQGPPCHDLTHDGFVQADIYDHPEWYVGDPGSPAARETIRVLKAVRNQPSASVTIYRSAPRGEFNTGDWVALSHTYAKESGFDAEDEAKDTPVWSATVPASTVLWAGDDLNEWGYWGAPISARTASLANADWGLDQLDLPEQANDGDCLWAAPLVAEHLRPQGLNPRVVTVLGFLGENLLSFAHQAVLLGDGRVVDATATQFNPDLDSLLVLPRADYCAVLGQATGTTVQIEGA